MLDAVAEVQMESENEGESRVERCGMLVERTGAGMRARMRMEKEGWRWMRRQVEERRERKKERKREERE